MNYIKRLENEVAGMADMIKELNDGMSELRAYLQSDKFNCGDDLDGYVHINDVLNRLPRISGPEAHKGGTYVH